MPQGKPAGVRCAQLDSDNACRIFDRPERPAVCAQLQPSAEMCGRDAQHAMVWLARMETLTAPSRSRSLPGGDVPLV
jgi:uncharacterized protein